jgi:octaheme c-type cytochrome (tetrathionate reductase family)
MKKQRSHWHAAALFLGWLVSFGVLVISGAAGAAANSSTADHSKFKELQQTFKTGPDVTKACLKCHTEAAKQIQKTTHWTWEYRNPANGQLLGKKHLINNFCISEMSNEAFCNACHIGYGWKDDTFDFTKQENVDCLVCHDTTGAYKKAPGMAGHPAYKPIENPPGSGKFIQPVDLKNVAQHVGKTSRDTCGACHFFGGGGDGVKHGDLDSSLSSPGKELDVHMDAVGNDFTCATCHMTTGHQVPGSRYAPTAMDKSGPRMRGKTDTRNPTTCQACHGDRPHPVKAAQLNNHGDKLNDHARIIACETCHTPSFARGGVPTKMSWDWSTAGKLTPEGKPFVTKDDKGHVIYDSRKGDFVLSENVSPGYTWFNGTVKYTLLTDKIEMIDGVIHINSFAGSPDDGKSMIWPVKVFRGSQPYDPVNQTLVVPHTTGSDDTGYWKNFNWEKAITTGMATAHAPFSGKIAFAKTVMYWPIAHMVAPKAEALSCQQCHSANGRLKDIKGVYMPGRDASKLLDMAGWTIALLALIGVLIHGGLRIINSNKKG